MCTWRMFQKIAARTHTDGRGSALKPFASLFIAKVVNAHTGEGTPHTDWQTPFYRSSHRNQSHFTDSASQNLHRKSDKGLTDSGPSDFASDKGEEEIQWRATKCDSTWYFTTQHARVCRRPRRDGALLGRDKRVVAELAVLRVLTIWECVCSTRGDRELPCSRFLVAKFLLMASSPRGLHFAACRSRDSMARFARRNPSASPPPDYAAKA